MKPEIPPWRAKVRGRPVATSTWKAAEVAHQLQQMYGASADTAARAALLDRGTEKDIERVLRAMRKLQRGPRGKTKFAHLMAAYQGDMQELSAQAARVRDAADHLPHSLRKQSR